MAGPLEGINVLEFSVVVAGPATGMHLSDLGARVIKVESPGGEPFRANGAVVKGHGKAFTWLNHGKESIEIDVAHPSGRDAIHRLIPNIDVVVINFRPGVAARLGIDYATLSAIRPDLVYADISGFGSSGPLASRSASDIVAQAYGGAIALDGKSDEHGAPLPVSMAVGDAPTGMAAAMAVLAALFHRARTGEGQIVRASLLRTVLNLTGFNTGREPRTDPVVVQPLLDQMDQVREQGGSYTQIMTARDQFTRRQRGTNLFYGGYSAKDGGIVLGALTPANRNVFRRVLGIEGDRSDEPDFDPRAPENLAIAEQLREQVRQRLQQHTVDEWVAIFDEAGAPVAPVNYPELLALDHHAGGMFVDVTHEAVGAQRIMGPLFEMDRTPTRVAGPAPISGAHSARVLSDLGGYTATEIEALRSQQVIA